MNPLRLWDMGKTGDLRGSSRSRFCDTNDLKGYHGKANDDRPCHPEQGQN